MHCVSVQMLNYKNCVTVQNIMHLTVTATIKAWWLFYKAPAVQVRWLRRLSYIAWMRSLMQCESTFQRSFYMIFNSNIWSHLVQMPWHPITALIPCSSFHLDLPSSLLSLYFVNLGNFNVPKTRSFLGDSFYQHSCSNSLQVFLFVVLSCWVVSNLL